MLESELSDTKRQLHDMSIAKGKIELEKRELEALLMEAHSNVRDVDEVSMSDRAKRMLVTLRMERFAERSNAMASAIRKKCALASISVKTLREECMRTKEAFRDQMRRLESLFSGKSEALVRMAGTIQVAALTACSTSPHHQAPSAGQQQQQGTEDKHSVADTSSRVDEHIPMAASSYSHTSASDEKLFGSHVTTLITNIDSLIRLLNLQWAGLDVFTNGPIPQIAVPRRFVDPMVNLENYATVTLQITAYLNQINSLSIITGEMRSPALTKISQTAMLDIDSKYNQKLNVLSAAMRAIRTAVGMKKTVSGLLRIVMSVDVAREEGKLLVKEYRELSAQHTTRCFRYMGHMFMLVKKYMAAMNIERKDRIGIDPEHFVDENALIGAVRAEAAAQAAALTITGKSEVSVKCTQCGVDLICYDCNHATTFPKSVAHIVNHRRWLVMQFTHQRVQHFQSLMTLLDRIGSLLKKLKLIPQNWETTTDDRLVAKSALLAGSSEKQSSSSPAAKLPPPVTQADASKLVAEGLNKLRQFQDVSMRQSQPAAVAGSGAPAQSAVVAEDPSVEGVNGRGPRGSSVAGLGRNSVAPAAASVSNNNDEPTSTSARPHNGLGSTNYFAELRKRKAHLQATELLDRRSLLNEVAPSNPQLVSPRAQYCDGISSSRIAQTEYVEDTLRVLDHFSPRKPYQLAIKQRPHFLDSMLAENSNNNSSSEAAKRSSIRKRHTQTQ